MTKSSVRLAAAIALLAGGYAGAAEAEVAAGIVLDAKGAIAPTIVPLSEVEAGQKYALGADGRMTIVHYKTCRTLTVVGGSVTFNFTQLVLDGGKVEDEKRRCPKRFQLADGGSTTAGGLVLRGAGSPQQITQKPIIVLSGPRAARMGEAELRGASGVIARWPAGTRRLEMPANAAALAAGGEYELVLRNGQSGSTETHKFAVVAGASAEAVDNTTILSLE